MTYFGNANPDLLAMMPLTAECVLELGCGEGALAAAYLRRNPAAHYTAVEAHAPSAAVARGRVHRLMTDHFEAIGDDVIGTDGPFDLIALGDVLEHMADPAQVLQRLKGHLAPGGHLAISIPNVSHWTAFAHLFEGRWPAEDAGLFDRTHLRFFTLQSVTQLLVAAGFRVLRARPRQFLLDKAAAERWIAPLADLAERMGIDRTGFLQRASTLQYVVLAQLASDPAPAPLYLKTIAFAPRFMDVRARLPAEQLASDPALVVHYDSKAGRLPALPAETPKILIAQRVIPLGRAEWAEQAARAIRNGWVTVAEWDDHPNLFVQHAPDAIGTIRGVLAGSHAVQTSTPTLAEVLCRDNPEVAVFANAAFDLPPLPAAWASGPVRIFYGALNREGFGARVARALTPILRQNPSWQFEVVHDRAFFDALQTEAKRFHPPLPYDAYLQMIGKCDIALLPLEGTLPELSKSDVKYVECAARGVAVIASPAVYSDSVQHETTGLIAPAVEDWPACLARLGTDAALRRRLAAAAWDDIRRNRMFAYQIATRTAWYRDLWARRDALNAALCARRPDIAEALRALEANPAA